MRSTRLYFALIHLLVVVAATLLFVPAIWSEPKFKVLHGIYGGMFSSLTLDAKGNLYGVTNGGGTYGHGMIFELKPQRDGKWSEIVVHNFNGTDGAAPNGGLIFDQSGNMYGTTNTGGEFGGTIFELTPGRDFASWTCSILYNFCPEGYGSGCPEGAPPDAGVVMDSPGNLYGTTGGGGANGGGVAYQLAPSSGGWSYSVLHNFSGENEGKDGWTPYAPLILDVNNNLYGTTAGGGAYTLGTVFQLIDSSGSWQEDLLYSFCSGGFPCNDGAGPDYGLVFDGSGNFYGTTPGGGANNCGGAGCGAVFELTPDGNGGWKEKVLYSFKPGESGFDADSPVIFDGSGNVYGTTALGGIPRGCGGDGCGVVYKLTPGTGGNWKYTVMHKFDGADGANPGGGLILDSKGHLYGTAYSTVFEITP
jgi:uncharacterized repeat protein (TIGR03803 family)